MSKFLYLHQLQKLHTTMKNFYYYIFLLFASFSQAQTTVIEDFENGIPSTWAIFETGTGVAQSWAGSNTQAFICQGNGCAIINRENVASGLAIDWLVSPSITVPANGKLYFATKTLQAGFQGSFFSVKVSTTSQTDPNSFTTVATWNETTLTTAANVCEQIELNLSAYAGQNIYLAFIMENDNGDRWIIDYITKELNYHFSPIAFIDTNDNGIKDINEPTFRHGNFQININNSTPTNYNSSTGILHLYSENLTDLYDISFTVYPEFASIFSTTVTYNNVSIATLVNNGYAYFPIHQEILPPTPISDVEINLNPFNSPMPGAATYINFINYKNNGELVENGVIQFTKPSNVLINYISDTNAVLNSNGFTLNYTNLQPLESRTFYVKMSVPTIPTVQIGAFLTSSASINTPNNDILQSNNFSELRKAIIAAYDPNEKHENHGPTIVKDDFTSADYLTYTIHFQNTGTANTSTIRVEDFLDAKLDPASIRMISSSHNYVLSMQNNHLVWKFDPIYLTPMSVDEPNSQGYITFKVKPFPGYQVGDIIPNTASIYFDTNPAIVTNTFQTEFIAALSNESFSLRDIVIYPNPSNDFINIQVGQYEDKIESIEITDILGKIVFQSHFENKINITNFNQGVYFMTLITKEKEKFTTKIIKN